MTSTSSNDQFAEHFVRGQRRLHTYIATLVPNYCDADEIFQETCLLVWQKRDEYDESRDFVRWTCGIALNLVRNLRRRADRANVNLSDEVLEILSSKELERQSGVDDRLAALRHCLGTLSARQAKLLKDCYATQSSARTVAEQRGLLPATLYQQLHRVRRALLNCIELRLAREEA